MPFLFFLASLLSILFLHFFNNFSLWILLTVLLSSSIGFFLILKKQAYSPKRFAHILFFVLCLSLFGSFRVIFKEKPLKNIPYLYLSSDSANNLKRKSFKVIKKTKRAPIKRSHRKRRKKRKLEHFEGQITEIRLHKSQSILAVSKKPYRIWATFYHRNKKRPPILENLKPGQFVYIKGKFSKVYKERDFLLKKGYTHRCSIKKIKILKKTPAKITLSSYKIPVKKIKKKRLRKSYKRKAFSRRRKRGKINQYFSGEVSDLTLKKNLSRFTLSQDAYKIYSVFWHRNQTRPEIFNTLKNGNFIYMEGSFSNVKTITLKNKSYYLYVQGFTHRASVKKITILDHTKKDNSVQSKIIQYLSHSKYFGLQKALILGGKSELQDKSNRFGISFSQIFRKNNTVHLLVISGLHIGILASLIYFLIHFFPLSPKQKLLFVGLFLAAYLLLLSKSSFSAYRAVFFTLTLSFAKLLERKVSLLDMLFLAAGLLLLCFPRMLYSLGFQLSFLATFGILFLLPLFNPLAKKVKNRPLKYIVEAFFVGVAAQIFIFPLLFSRFHIYNFISLFISIPLGILLLLLLYFSFSGFLVFLISSFLGKFFLMISDIFLDWILTIQLYFYPVKIFTIYSKNPPSFWVWIIYFALILILRAFLKKKLNLKELTV